MEKFRIIQSCFGNSRRFVTDRGTAFTSNDFKEFVEPEGIEHVMITTGVPRGNGQVERVNGTIFPVLTKVSTSNPSQWYKHLPDVQCCLNSTIQRSIGTTPFQLLTGIKMRHKNNLLICEAIDEELISGFNDDREEQRSSARLQMQKIQKENRRNYDKKRKKARYYL